MKRKAFLIGSPMIEGTSSYLSGVTPDIINMKKHLKSNAGGAWEDGEIEIFKNPTREDLYNMMIHESYDFVIIQYSGHGFVYKTNGGTILNINSKEIISLIEIHNWINCPKRYYFIDCCRGIAEDSEFLTRSFSASESYRTYADRIVCRDKYNKIVEKCENGTSIIYSCGLNESADEDGLGGIFSLSYFRSVEDTRKVPPNEYYSIKAVFNMAVARMKNDYPMADQNPVMKPERRIKHFPFKV